MRITGMDSKADVVGVCCGLPTQDDSMDELFPRQLGEILGSVTLSLQETSTSQTQIGNIVLL